MKETGFLNVLSDRNFKEQQIIINPNDGFDLGLMTTEATVDMYVGDSLDVLDDPNAEKIPSRIYQKNECRLGTVELSYKVVGKLGGARKVRLHLQDDSPYPKLLVGTV